MRLSRSLLKGSNFRKSNVDKFRCHISYSDFSQIWTHDNVNEEQWMMLDGTFRRIQFLRAVEKVKMNKSVGSDNILKVLKEGAEWLSSYTIFLQSCIQGITRLLMRFSFRNGKLQGLNLTLPTDITDVHHQQNLWRPRESYVLSLLTLESLFSPNLYAFREHGSAQTALIRIYYAITTCMYGSKKKAVRMICVELTRAFNKRPHSVLINGLISMKMHSGWKATEHLINFWSCKYVV